MPTLGRLDAAGREKKKALPHQDRIGRVGVLSFGWPIRPGHGLNWHRANNRQAWLLQDQLAGVERHGPSSGTASKPLSSELTSLPASSPGKVSQLPPRPPQHRTPPPTSQWRPAWLDPLSVSSSLTCWTRRFHALRRADWTLAQGLPVCARPLLPGLSRPSPPSPLPAPVTRPTSPPRTPRRRPSPSSTPCPATRSSPRPPSCPPLPACPSTPSATSTMSSTRRPSSPSVC